MHLLGFNDIFTTRTCLTRVRAVPRYSFSIDTLEGLNTMRPTIGIMPSGNPWVVKPAKGDDNLFGSLLTSHYKKKKASANGGTCTDKLNGSLGAVERFHEYIFSVPYSDHSCFAEIEEFIKLIKPTSLKGIVSSSSCYVDPLYYFGRFCGVNQLSQRLPYKHEIKKRGRTVVAVQTKSYFESGNSSKVEKKRTARVDYQKVNGSRVSILRRVRRGAKIMENECPD